MHGSPLPIAAPPARSQRTQTPAPTRATHSPSGTPLGTSGPAAIAAHDGGLRVNMGHGLDYDNVAPVARLPHVEELNIGFAIVARSVFTGVDEAVGSMVRLCRGGNTR